MKIFPNTSAGVSQFGYVLFSLAILSSIVFFVAFPSDFEMNFFNGSIAVAGLVAISVGKQLKNLEDRLDKVERNRSSS
jgi:hypothetical protein